MTELFTVDELVSQSYMSDNMKRERMKQVVARARALSEDPGFPPGIEAVTIVPMILLGGDIQKITAYMKGRHGGLYLDVEFIMKTMDQFMPLFNTE